MPESDHLDSILERIIARTHSDADIQVLRQALQEGQLALATGERAVAVGGDMNDSVIVTGEGNVVHIFKSPDAEIIRRVFQQVMASVVPRAVLTHVEFSARAEQASLASHQGPCSVKHMSGRGPCVSPRVVIAMGESREAAVLLITAERRPRCAV
jgi:hypothetical protein